MRAKASGTSGSEAPSGGPVCVVWRAETKPGQDDVFESLLRDLACAVRGEEAGCTSYLVTRALGSRRHFAVHARFLDWTAFTGHADTPHFSRVAPRLSALMASPVGVEIFFEV